MIIEYKGKRPAVLADALVLLSADDNIAVGSSSAYIFFGTASEWAADEQTLSEYYREQQERMDKNFEPFENRRIKDIFYKLYPGEPKYLAVIIEGNEIGLVWSRSEYEHRKFAWRRGYDFETA